MADQIQWPAGYSEIPAAQPQSQNQSGQPSQPVPQPTAQAPQPSSQPTAPQPSGISWPAGYTEIATPTAQSNQSGQQSQSAPTGPTISPRTPSMWERVKNALTYGAPEGSAAAEQSGKVYQPGQAGQEQLVKPEELLTPAEKEKHPFINGGLEFAGGLTTPDNFLMMAASGGLGELPGVAGKMIPRLVSAGFGFKMIKGAYNQIPLFQKAMAEGNEAEAERILTHITLGAAFGTHAAEHAVGGEAPKELVPGSTNAIKEALGLPIQAAVEAGKNVASKVGEKIENRAASKKAAVSNDEFLQANKDFKSAIPPTKSAPYNDNDLIVANNYLEPHHEGVEPIRSVQHTVDALDHSIEGIENKVAEHVGIIPNEPIATDVLADTHAALEQNERGKEFVDAGMDAVKSLNLDNITMERADSVRRQLNLENKAILKKNNYDLASARAADPSFAAREAASQSLRDGIYNQLEAHGIEGVRDLRQEEGSLIKVRNAAQNQIFNADKIVKNSSGASTAKQIAAKVARGGGALVGAGAGGAALGTGGAMAGAAAGQVLGDIAGNAIASPDLTRDELIERRFGKKIATGEPGNVTVNLRKPEEAPPPVGTQGEMFPKATPGTSEQGDIFSQEAPYPAPMGALQSVRNQNIMLQKEMRPLQAILNDPVATQADKVEAARKLANLPLADLNKAIESLREPLHLGKEDNGGGGGNGEVFDAPLDIPKKILPEGHTAESALMHELGHAAVAHLEGFKPVEIRSHLHPDNLNNRSVATTKVDFGVKQNPDGTIDEQDFLKNVPNFLSTFMGGAAADEVISGIPFEKNQKGIGSDIKAASDLLKNLGFTPEDSTTIIKHAFERAKSHLSNPKISDMLRSEAAVREQGLPDSHHISQERMQDIQKKLDEARNEKASSDKGRSNERDDQHGQANVAGKESGSKGGSNERVPNQEGKEVNLSLNSGLAEKSSGDTKVDADIKTGGGVPGGAMEHLALIHDPVTGSTLALPKDRITPELVKAHMAASRKTYGIQ